MICVAICHQKSNIKIKHYSESSMGILSPLSGNITKQDKINNQNASTLLYLQKDRLYQNIVHLGSFYFLNEQRLCCVVAEEGGQKQHQNMQQC
jgi:hypothetical protein